MPITNLSKPTTSLTNTARVATGETWATITPTWATETRTWQGCASLLTDSAKPLFIVDSYSESNQDGSSNLRTSSSSYKVAQTFTVSASCTLDSVKFYLKKVGSPTGNSYAKIYALSGGAPTGSALAISDAYLVSALSSSAFTLSTLTFSGVNRIILTAVSYAVSFEPDDLVAGTNTVFGTDITSPSHAGTQYIYNNVSWSSQASDVCFYVYALGNQMTNFSKPL